MSHHQDHIGCIPDVLASVRVDHVEDRGRSYVSTYYDDYVKAVKGKRATANVGDKIILDPPKLRRG